ncbi:hypothetical protein RJ639_000366 [Escallonia herrerae]|uniref:ABC transmembrane type-1 domain-containing protein n=1 Tax=Escallonia herrerae TaxID=1293975 RepID=A0AA89BGU5_9ASTE|nr:hypothetical protein RJ639_000366 [Escallonia herrerae]
MAPTLTFHHSLPPLLAPPALHHTQTFAKPYHQIRPFTTRTRSLNNRFSHIPAAKSAYLNGHPVLDNSGEDDEAFGYRLRRWVGFVRSILPGGSWWKFSDDVVVVLTAKPVTVWRALSRMWELIAEDRWVIFAGFSVLILTSLSEISIPHFLTASIFTAQSGNVTVFHRNVRLLVLLCITSGICRLKSCMVKALSFFVLQTRKFLLWHEKLPFWHCKYDPCEFVKRMRERLYSTLLLQDISFFDTQTVGGLTSRLGSDCQQVSRVIGNDLNLILRNLLQGSGALIYLLILSWPLGLCTLAICSTLSAIILIHGQYQKKAAKLSQEFTASANEVAQETFSLMRTVRVYGAEKKELGRYKQWLGKLADISVRQSSAYGFWNLGFNILYHSTQVIAVLVGGMSILAGHLTAEQLTKFILYSEWLIYSTWWVGDNLSSLMQSVGASEKVFQLMDLSPSDQFTSNGLKLQRLGGKIEFVNVSFYYPSRAMIRLYYAICYEFKKFDNFPIKQVPVLQRFNFLVHPNEVVAIVGLSGSGKSTLMNLLLRLYEPTSGQILIDGHALQDLDVKWLRERIGYVGQGVLRAVRDDPETERTVIVIAHRLSTIQAADRIVVMDSGKIIEMGNHTELLLRDGLYARLTRRQADAVA